MARLLADMGKAVEGDTPKAIPPAQEPALAFGGIETMGDVAKRNAEKKESAPKTEEKPSETPPAGEKKPEETAKPPTETKPPEGETKPPVAGTTPPAEEPVKVEKAKPIEEIVEGIVSARMAKAPAPAPAAPPPPQAPTVDPDAEYISTLDEKQRDAVELARYAAVKMPDRYGNLPKQTLSFFKRIDQYISKARAENKDWDPEEDDDYKELIAESRPSYQPGDQRKLERSMVVDEVRKELEAEYEPKFKALDKKSEQEAVKPVLDEAAKSYEQNVVARVSGEKDNVIATVVATATQKGWDEASKVDPLAAKLAKQQISAAVDYGREVLALASGATGQVAYDPRLPEDSPHNTQAVRQAKLFRFIDQQEQAFVRSATPQMKVVDGRTFVPRAQFSGLTEAERAKHWTMGPDIVLEMLRDWAAITAKQQYEAEIERRKAEGFVRPAPTQPPKTETPAPAAAPAAAPSSESPKAKVTPGVGAANPSAQPPPNTLFSREELEHLWGGGPAVMRG